MMSGPYFEQLRTRLKGLGLGRVGMKKLKNSHKGRVVRKFRTRGCVVRVLCENFAQGTIHPPKCKIGFFQMAITSSFQIQIAHRLKQWTPDFLSFKTTYGMHNLSSRKCSKNVSNSSKMGCGCNIPFQLCTVVFKRP